MKKITLLLILVLPVFGFSQSNLQKIQSYLDQNHKKFGLHPQDITDWNLEKEVFADGTKITSCYVVQRYQGTEIYNAQSNFWIKNGQVINAENNFISNIAPKVNSTTPQLSAMAAISSAYTNLGITVPVTFSVIETISSKKLVLTDGTSEDIINAKLVYQLMPDNKLRLAWAFQFYEPSATALWDLRIDALDGKILEKNNLTISCNFGGFDHTGHNHNTKAFSFIKNAFNKKATLLEVNAGAYRVIPYNYMSPDETPFQLISSPSNSVASPYGWHNVVNGGAGSGFTITRGNNVWAQEDINGNNGTGASPDGGSALNFDFPYGGKTAQPATYTNAATTNLFYMNNIMHDVYYQYGFNEASANFQQNNYGNGGITNFTGDAVIAEAQDGQANNNANFATPSDGGSASNRPRMQMYLWTAYAPPFFPLTILTPADIAGPRQANDNVFEPGHVAIPAAPAFIESDLVLYDDGTPDPGLSDNADGCGAAINAAAINGHIVVIRRSLSEENGGAPCPFTEKVKNAQNAGATAVIIVNNVPGSETVSAAISMSGADATITIPAISLTQEIGEALIARMKIETVHAKLQGPEFPFVAADGSFENTIIAHEYGHGISNRLIGGGTATCMSNYESMGEGWSDWFGLMLQIKPGDNGAMAKSVANYVKNEPVGGPGIRQYPYSTDMSVNPLTLADTNTPIPTEPTNTAYRYFMGDAWATVLWDLTWAYIAKYGFDPNIYTGTGGNNKVMRLVLDALKLQACNQSSFVTSRNMLIAADQATTGGADYCMITEVFRRRGMGVNASSGLANNPNDQVEDFTPFPAGANCSLAVDYFDAEEMIRVYPNPTNGQLNIRINQYSGKINLQVVDINGRIVFSIKDDNFNIEKAIDLSHLQAGIYVLKVDGDAVNSTHKIILN